MSPLVLAALASVRGPGDAPSVDPVGACAQAEAGWVCRSGATQLVAIRRPVGVLSPEDASRARFALLADWPSGSFGPAWAGDQLGWHAEVGDGERAQVVRWWVRDGWLFTASVAGPAEEVRALAPAWMASVRFPDLEAP